MYDFKEIENHSKKIWKSQEKEIKKAIKDNPKKKLFSFLEGPPTANAPPGIHHLEMRTIKDIVCKYKYMRGFSVPRKGGWDCHGLPVEVQVEKALGLKDKQEVIKYGEDKFIEKCKTDVFSNIKDWNESTQELAYWVDLENPYVTLKNDYIESVWWSLSELYKKNLLYEGHKVVPFCPRCGTPLSSHEVAQGYQEVEENSVVLNFKVKDEENTYLLVWTTTPWTLPSNVAVAINPDLNYSYVESDGKIYILVENLVEKYLPEGFIISTIKGKDLLGKEYVPLFPYFKDLEGAFKVISGEFVTTDDGTGLVHIAPAFGEVDYDVCKQNKIPFVQPVDEAGKFTKEVPDYFGEFIKNTDQKIIERLKNEGKLFKVIKYSHDYPFCWRCKTPLMYYAIKSWFIKTTAVKEKLVKLNKKINWYPAHIKEGRFGLWLENIKDWNLSRLKFWGTPLPIWKCSCGEEIIIGSVEELRKKSIKPFKNYDLHRPWIDKIKIKCKCGKEMSRVPDLIDCWYDSGSATFAQFHYPFENKKEFERRVPYDFIAEGIDQTRGWFYTLHAISTMLFEEIAFKNVICAELLVDEKGEKMSKSKGNIIKPREAIDAVGVDAVRLQMCTTDVGLQKRFSTNLVKESILPFLNVLYNCNTYYLQSQKKKNKKQIEDKWILSKLNSTIKAVEKDLDNYSIDNALLKIMDFSVNDFSRKYIKITRGREDNREILGEILEKISLILAPYAPYIAEYIYSKFYKKSVHLSKWPKYEEKIINKKLEEEFEIVCSIIEKGLAERDKEKIGLKWPLAKAIVTSENKPGKEFEEIIKSQLNIKKIEWKKVLNSSKKDQNKDYEVKLDTIITPDLESEGYARELSRQIQAFRKNLGLKKEDRVDIQIVSDSTLVKILENQKEFLKERTNADSFSIVTTVKEKFKKKVDFNIKGKRGEILVRLKNNHQPVL